MRINRQPTDKPHARVRTGDVLTLSARGDVLVLRVRALAVRRGPAPEARLLYEEIAPPDTDAGARPCADAAGSAYPPASGLSGPFSGD